MGASCLRGHPLPPVDESQVVSVSVNLGVLVGLVGVVYGYSM